MLTRVRQRLKEDLPVTLVPYGDSISQIGLDPNYHGGCSSDDANWAMQTAQLPRTHYPGRQFLVKPFGIGGHNTYEGVGRFDWMPKNADLVLIEFGANDSGWHIIPPEATATAMTRLIECINYVHKSDIAIFGYAGTNPLNPQGQHEEETRAAIREVTTKHTLPYVDLRTAILRATDNGRRWTDYHNGVQDCHPNDAGHRVWAETVYEVLNREIGEL